MGRNIQDRRKERVEEKESVFVKGVEEEQKIKKTEIKDERKNIGEKRKRIEIRDGKRGR